VGPKQTQHRGCHFEAAALIAGRGRSLRGTGKGSIAGRGTETGPATGRSFGGTQAVRGPAPYASVVPASPAFGGPARPEFPFARRRPAPGGAACGRRPDSELAGEKIKWEKTAPLGFSLGPPWGTAPARGSGPNPGAGQPIEIQPGGGGVPGSPPPFPRQGRPKEFPYPCAPFPMCGKPGKNRGSWEGGKAEGCRAARRAARGPNRPQ